MTDDREPQRSFIECRPILGGSMVLLYYLDSVPLVLCRAVMNIYHGENYLFQGRDTVGKAMFDTYR